MQWKKVTAFLLAGVLCAGIAGSLTTSAADSNHYYDYDEQSGYYAEYYVGEDFANFTGFYDTIGADRALSQEQRNIVTSCKLLDTVDGIPVKYISSSSFFNYEHLKEFNVPAYVIQIGIYAFMGCTELTSVTLPEGLTTIESYAFCACPNLKSVVIPESVTKIGKYAFAYSEFFDDGDPPNYDFVIYGVPGSAAETYANANKLVFKAIEASSVIVGDVDRDGVVNAADAACILQYAAATGSGSGEVLPAFLTEDACDVDKSGKADAVDAAYVLAYAAELGSGHTGTLTDYLKNGK